MLSFKDFSRKGLHVDGIFAISFLFLLVRDWYVETHVTQKLKLYKGLQKTFMIVKNMFMGTFVKIIIVYPFGNSDQCQGSFRETYRVES